MNRILASLLALSAVAFAMIGPAVAQTQVVVGKRTITAPETVDRNEVLAITLEGVRGGQMEVWGPITGGSGSAPDGLLLQVPVDAGTARLVMRLRPGSYELRHVSSSGRVRARRVIDVSAVPVSLLVTNQMIQGRTAEIRWRGPADPGDRLQIVDTSEGIILEEVHALGEPGEYMLTEIDVPDLTGEFRLRYVMGDGTVLRSVPVRVVFDWD